MTHLAKMLPGFSNLVRYVSDNPDFLRWMDLVDPEHHVPECWTVQKELSKSTRECLASHTLTLSVLIYYSPGG